MWWTITEQLQHRGYPSGGSRPSDKGEGAVIQTFSRPWHKGGGGGLQKIFFQVGEEGQGPPGPSPGSSTVSENITRVCFCKIN